MQTALNYSQNPTPQSMAHGLASLGRYGDSYMVHAAEGETVIPAEILLANPGLKADLFHQMQMMGIKDPNRYVVGNTLNSLNPVTGQPEFFWKQLRKFAPVLGAAIGQSILGPLGAPALAAGTAALVGEDPALFGIGTLATQALGRGISGAYGADPGVGNRLAGFGRGLTRGATDPFRALGNLFTAGPENPIAQGALGSTIMPKSAARFAELYPDQQAFSPYQTGKDIKEQAIAFAQQSPAGDVLKTSTAGGVAERQQLMETRRQLMTNSQQVGPDQVQTVYGTLTNDKFKEAVTEINRLIDVSSQTGIPSGGAVSPERFAELVQSGDLLPEDTMDVIIDGQIVQRTVGESPSTFMESLKSPQTLGNLAAFTVPAGLAYLAAKKDEDDDLTPEEVAAQERAADPQRVAYREAGTADPEQRDRLRAEAGLRPSYAFQGEQGIRRLARSMGISMDAARRYIGGYGQQYLQGGGEITGAGTGTSDSIPARLSDGEFVMTADAVRGAGNGSRDLGAARMYDLMSQFERTV